MGTAVLEAVFWLSAGALAYVYGGYYLLLRIITGAWRRFPAAFPIEAHKTPPLSVIIAVHNEERVIRARIENLLALGVPAEHLDIVIASDGSTDETVRIAEGFGDLGVRVLDYHRRRGKALTQNDAVREARYPLLVFSDADTEFAAGFLDAVSAPFEHDETVGCVVGTLRYRVTNTAVAESTQLYWQRETETRELESQLGLFCTATGACMALRRDLWRDLRPTDDSDFATPLDVIAQGYRVVQVATAVAYDSPPSRAVSEFRARVRMTSKNFAGTVRRWGPREWRTHPGVTWALFSHKILRWISPLFVITLALSHGLLALRVGGFYALSFSIEVAAVGLLVLGTVGELLGRRIPVASTVWSFGVANAGMAVGLLKGAAGLAPATYEQE